MTFLFGKELCSEVCLDVCGQSKNLCHSWLRKVLQGRFKDDEIYFLLIFWVNNKFSFNSDPKFDIISVSSSICTIGEVW